MKSNYILLVCFILITWVNTASAQTDDTSYFRCLAWSHDIPGLFVTQSELPEPTAENPNPAPDPDFKEDPLVIPGAVRSQIYSYQSSKPLKIIRHVGDKIILISTLDMLHAPHLALLFFIPGNDANAMAIRVIDDGVDTFPGGGVELFNFSHIVPTISIETSARKFESYSVTVRSQYVSVGQRLGSRKIDPQIFYHLGHVQFYPIHGFCSR